METAEYGQNNDIVYIRGAFLGAGPDLAPLIQPLLDVYGASVCLLRVSDVLWSCVHAVLAVLVPRGHQSRSVPAFVRVNFCCCPLCILCVDSCKDVADCAAKAKATPEKNPVAGMYVH